MIIEILLNLIGLTFFLFIFWRRLKEDYIGNQIFGTSFIVLVALFAAGIFAKQIASDFWFWISTVFVGVGLTIGIARYRLKIFEALEALVIGFLPWISFYFLADAIKVSSLPSMIGAIVVALLAITFIILDKRYKKFTWYKSGRVGFSGLIILGIFFLLRAIVELIYDSVLSFSGNQDIYFSGIAAFCAFLVLYNLVRDRS